MNDPWADVRELIKNLEDSDPTWLINNPGLVWLLADADALLAVVPFARHKKECQIARAWGTGPGGTFTDPHCNCGYEKVLAALSEYLKPHIQR